MYYNHDPNIITGFSGKRFWQWFDLMPKEVRDAVNYNIVGSEKTKEIWLNAIHKYGNQIQKLLGEKK